MMRESNPSAPPFPHNRKLVDVYLYLGIRDAAYLQLHAAALVAAAEPRRARRSTQNMLEPLLRRFGLNGTTDLVGVQRMRCAMLDLDSSADPEPIPMIELGLDSKNTARPNNDSPVNVWENLYDLAPKRLENPHASNFECDLDAASNAPTLEADEELAPPSKASAPRHCTARAPASAAPIPSPRRSESPPLALPLPRRRVRLERAPDAPPAARDAPSRSLPRARSPPRSVVMRRTPRVAATRSPLARPDPLSHHRRPCNRASHAVPPVSVNCL